MTTTEVPASEEPVNIHPPYASPVWDAPVKDHGDGVFTSRLVEPQPYANSRDNLTGEVTTYVCGHVITHARGERCGCSYVTESGEHIKPGFPGGRRPKRTERVTIEITGLPDTGHWVKLNLPPHIQIKEVRQWGLLLARRGDIARPYDG